MLNHDYEIIEPKHWTDVVSPRSKLRMHFFGFTRASQSAGVPKSGAILPADCAFELCRQYRWHWRTPDGTVAFLGSDGTWIELKDAGRMGRNQLRMPWVAPRRIFGWMERDLHDRIVDSEGVHLGGKWSVSNAHRCLKLG